MSTQELATAIATALGATMEKTLGPLLQSIAQLSQAAQPRPNLVDTRGMGRPPSFSGSEKDWREWKGKLSAYLCATNPQAEFMLEWVEKHPATITTDALQGLCLDKDTGAYNESNYLKVASLNKSLFLILIDTCKGEPYRLVESAGNGNGFEAWRVLLRRYHSKTPGTKRALLQQLFSLKPATTIESFESLLLTIEESIRRYDGMAESVMSEDIRCAIVVACCPKELRDFLDMSSDEFVYADLRLKVNTYVERKRDMFTKGLQHMEHRTTGTHTPMDVSAAQWDWEEPHAQYWGGYADHHEDYEYEPDNQLTEEEHHELSYFYKGGGRKGKSKGKGKSFGKSGPTYPNPVGAKSSGKGDGAKGEKGKGGKGKGIGTYNGYCHWCARWGHSAQFCRD